TYCRDVRGPDRRVCTRPAPVRHTWLGCVGSRRNSANLDPDYTQGEAKVPGFLDLQCGDEILPLTSNMARVRAKVAGLTTHGETYSAAGLIWGQRMVDFGEPFPLTRMSDNGQPPRRIVIFMTDGNNTRSRVDELHTGTNRSDADDVSERVCDGMHADPDLEVYTVSFKVTNTRAKRLVQSCATELEMYYDAENGTRLNEAFEDIAYSLLSPRLTQ
ncbi:MAG: hypothetical protein WBF53_05440, partial [Litorimonas sp.]